VQVDVGENDIPKVKLGDTALIEVDAFNNRKFKGVVYKIANPSTGLSTSSSLSSSTQVTNYQVHIRLFADSYKDLIVKGQPFPFRPNMSASADIQTKTNKNVLTVPLNAVTTRDKNEGKNISAEDKNKDESKTEAASSDDDIIEVVFVVQKDGIVRKKPVKTDIQDINYIQVLEGINNGDEVVSAPYDVISKQLQDSSKVKVVTKDELLKNFSAPK
jgi:HlyD family secretion protein